MARWCCGLILLGALGALTACSSGETIPRPPDNSYVIDQDFDFAAAGVVVGTPTVSDSRGAVRGTVVDGDGEPVAGAEVALYRLMLREARQAGVGSAVTSTNSAGVFAFGQLPPGPYRVVTQGRQRDVTVTAGDVVPLGFSLGRKWTVMVFMNADNDLEGFGVQDINELEQLPNSDEVTIIALMDRSAGFNSSNGNWTDTRRFVIRHDNDPITMTSARSPAEGGQAELLGELDTGSPVVLRQFIEYCLANYPADHYLVDLWNHGAGWRDRSTRGVLYDDTNRTFVSTLELPSGLDVGQRLDVLAFDASLMQMVEVAYQIRRQTAIVVGSEESPPGYGYPYDDILAPLIANPGMTPEALARNIVEVYLAVEGQRSQVTQSALWTDRLAQVRDAVNLLSSALANRSGVFANELASARNSTQRYGFGDPQYEGNRDLLHFAQLAASATGDAQIINGASQVALALDQALIAEGDRGAAEANSHGLAIFLPNQAGWRSLRSDYRELDWGQDAQWDEWLDVFYGTGD